MRNRILVSLLVLVSLFSFAVPQKDADKAPSKHGKATAAAKSPAKKLAKKIAPARSKAAAGRPAAKSTAKPTAKKHAAKATAQRAVAKPGRKVSPLKFKQMQRTFTASSELRPMALQLAQRRTPAAYGGVEDYARRHAGTDAGALAWLSVGYARLQDEQYAAALAALEKARPRAGELMDYVLYLEAQCFAGQKDNAKVVELLRHFEDEAPESVLLNDVVPLYGGALDATGHAQDAVNYLEAHRAPQRASVELALGKAYLHAQNTVKGGEILRHVYFTMPVSEQAEDAAVALSSASLALEGRYQDEKIRADLLAKGGRPADAVKVYRELEERAPLNEIGNVQVALAATLRKSNPTEARRLLQQAQATGEANAQRYYLLVEFARSDNDESAVLSNLDALRRAAPQGEWTQKAFISAANMELLLKNYDRAIALFREAQQRDPAGDQASYAHWKAAWMDYRQGHREQAKHDFEEQVAWYPARTEVPAAVYWRARIAEDERDLHTARMWYGKLDSRFRNYYYGMMAHERLKALGGATEPVRDAILAKIPDVGSIGPEALQTSAPENQLRSEKAKLLVNAGMNEFAVRELEAERGGQGARWSTLQIAQIYQQSGDHHRAMRFLKKAVPGYYAMDVSALPMAYWEILFPRPYWAELKQQAAANGLDPYLVASLIRQESEFDPMALSRANAMGLMQLLPTVGRSEAKAARIKKFNTQSLFDPATNLRLGTHFFRTVVDGENGQVEYALAAYNAGANRVSEWMQNGSYRDVPEFVESIPFTETREYVQAIMRNAQVYQRLYPR
ncbi:MAG: transglycosylase SLT domain-containing protein [Acidobacteriota bacterium]|nr:transglycosylase SLT domain-containing protein [Acidobacteriota bacterium]